MPNLQKIVTGGMITGPSKASQPENLYRRLLNCWQDSNGDIRNLGTQQELNAYTPPGFEYTLFIRRFTFNFQLGDIFIFDRDQDQLKFANEGIFWVYVFEDSGDYYQRYVYLYPDGTEREFQVNFVQASASTGWIYSDSVADLGQTIWKGLHSNTEVRNKVFFDSQPSVVAFPAPDIEQYGLKKFDGLQGMVAGLPGVYIGASNLSDTGDEWVTVVPFRLGFDGEPVAGSFLKFRVNKSGSNITLSTGISATAVTSTSTGYQEGESSGYDLSFYDTRYIVKNAPASEVSPGVWEIPSSSFFCEVGDYVFHDAGNNVLRAFKVLEISAGNWVRIKTDLYREYSFGTNRWSTQAGSFVDGDFQYFTSIYNLVYTSPTDSNYTFREALPMLRFASGTINSVIDTSVSADNYLNLTSEILSDWYDVTSVKTQFPTSIYAWSNYQDLLIGCDLNVLYFSDTTLGGCTEMTNGFANVIIPGEEYGFITGVCGAEDFIIICRERMSYVLTGNLATGNIRIKECGPERIGAYSPRSMVNAAGGVFITTVKGVYFINSAGTMTKISKGVSGLFQDSLQDIEEDGSVLPPIKMNKYFLERSIPAFGGDPAIINFDGNRVIMKYDELRNSIVIFFKVSTDIDQDDEGAALVYNIDNGSWQEWGKFPAGVADLVFFPRYSDITGAFDGSLMLLGDSTATGPQAESIENGTYVKGLVVGPWEVVGNPSIEKKILQLKFYGNIPETIIQHFENWQEWGDDPYAGDDPKTNVTFPASTSFFNKQRLNSNSSLCLSFAMDFGTNTFRLRGYEIEFNPIQEGMKK